MVSETQMYVRNELAGAGDTKRTQGLSTLGPCWFTGGFFAFTHVDGRQETTRTRAPSSQI